jgi:hypothetical protein
MTEKHYTHLAQSFVADTIRAYFPTLGITATKLFNRCDTGRPNLSRN